MSLLPIVDPDDLEGRRLLAPQPYQWDFATSAAEVTGLFGGWGSGKTYAGLEFINVCLMTNPPGSVGVVVLPTFAHMEEWLRDAFRPAFSNVIEGESVKGRCFYLPGGRKILYRSAHDPRSIQVSNASWIYMDEPHLMDGSIFIHVLARARRRGSRIRVGLTTLPRMGWLSDEFMSDDYLGQGTNDRRRIHAATAWNRFLEPGYSARLKSACPRRMWPCYLGGQFVAAGGSVYPEFDRRVHVVPWEWSSWVPMGGGHRRPTPVNYVFDWSVRKPHVLAVQRCPAGAVLPSGKASMHPFDVVIDEAYPDGELKGWTTQALCRMARRRAEDREYLDAIDCALQDIAGEGLQSTSGESDAVQARRVLGVPVVGMESRIKVGVDHVRLALEPFEGEPRLYISDRLLKEPFDASKKRRGRGIVYALEGYGYPDRKRLSGDEDPVKDGTYDHACDCIRYQQIYFHRQDRLSAHVRAIP